MLTYWLRYRCHVIHYIPLNSVTPRPDMITNILIILFKRSRRNFQFKIHTDRVPNFQHQDPNICLIPLASSWFIKCSKNTAKIFLTMPKTLCLGIGTQCRVNVKYLHPAKLMSETYFNKTAHTIVENILIIKQDSRVVNKCQQSVVIFFHDAFNTAEVSCMKRWKNSLMKAVKRIFLIETKPQEILKAMEQIQKNPSP